MPSPRGPVRSALRVGKDISGTKKQKTDQARRYITLVVYNESTSIHVYTVSVISCESLPSPPPPPPPTMDDEFDDAQSRLEDALSSARKRCPRGRRRPRRRIWRTPTGNSNAWRRARHSDVERKRLLDRIKKCKGKLTEAQASTISRGRWSVTDARWAKR